ncbi:hypothetical protein [Pantoea stewartii]|uniref:Uncharacterized protein n=1 Tax=Pantoea stewartii subsp. stewartii DC283 TaxID=660596 RepID=A0ABN4Z3C7_PANSE|nr:hypothetical protein [Pantoea stewartii]ARF51132.1 hypothetical protein DSJ_18625 [Pantoea stewartii subsp. stewartii DC283]KAB0558952.1 hypothetical protein F7Q90_03345 [Pantoea stewartii subsp. stewartii]
MFIHTDFLRAALCCVADQSEERCYLQGVNITGTHIQACNGHAFVSMEHGCVADVKGVFIIHGDIPGNAEGTLIQLVNEQWIASHMAEDSSWVGHNEVEFLESKYPDLSKLIAGEPESCDTLPILQAKYLALPYMMFSRDTNFIPVKFVSRGKGKPLQVLFDKSINYLYGNPQLIIMPMTEDTFERLEHSTNQIIGAEMTAHDNEKAATNEKSC